MGWSTGCGFGHVAEIQGRRSRDGEPGTESQGRRAGDGEPEVGVRQELKADAEANRIGFRGCAGQVCSYPLFFAQRVAAAACRAGLRNPGCVRFGHEIPAGACRAAGTDKSRFLGSCRRDVLSQYGHVFSFRADGADRPPGRLPPRGRALQKRSGGRKVLRKRSAGGGLPPGQEGMKWRRGQRCWRA